MNYLDFIKQVATNTGSTDVATKKTVDVVFATLAAAMQDGAEVNISNFGKFHVTERPGRMGRNPKTGEPVAIQASKAVKFKASKNLKDSI